jgi:hypothetical protein
MVLRHETRRGGKSVDDKQGRPEAQDSVLLPTVTEYAAGAGVKPADDNRFIFVSKNLL